LYLPFLALCVASYYGALSDRKGRRVIFKISSIGTILTMACYIITINYQHIFGVSLLFVAPLIRGLLAGENILIAATQAYISDCTTPARR
jgi:MFS family permease